MHENLNILFWQSLNCYGFSSGHVWMWKLDCEESWMPKNWCFWTVVLEKTLESPLDCKEIQPVHSQGDQSWVFFGRTDAKAETPILWPPHAKSWLIGKVSDAGRDWGQEEKGTTEDEMAGWHHWLDGHGFGWTLGISDGQLMESQGAGHEWATELNWIYIYIRNICFVDKNSPSCGLFQVQRQQKSRFPPPYLSQIIQASLTRNKADKNFS